MPRGIEEVESQYSLPVDAGKEEGGEGGGKGREGSSEMLPVLQEVEKKASGIVLGSSSRSSISSSSSSSSRSRSSGGQSWLNCF